MADYEVIVARAARKELESLPWKTADRIVAMLGRLEAEPRPVGARKLANTKHIAWRTLQS